MSARGQARGVAVLAVLLLASQARAERGLFAFSLEAGQSLDVSSTASPTRHFTLLGASEYGLAERWAVALGASAELGLQETTLSLSLGPRFTLFQGVWTQVHAFALPELLSPSSSPRGGLELGLRVGLGIRYQLMWGLGLAIQASVRGRQEAAGSSPPRLQGLIVGGLFIEA